MAKLSPEEWQQVSPYLHEALSLATQERAAWLTSFRQKEPGLAGLLATLLDEQQILKEEQVPDQTSVLGTMLGPYQLLSPLGAGGNGSHRL